MTGLCLIVEGNGEDRLPPRGVRERVLTELREVVRNPKWNLSGEWGDSVWSIASRMFVG